MNSDIRLAMGYHDNPKIRKLRRRIGLGAVEYHTRLLLYVAMHRPDGVLRDMTAEDVADAAGYPDDAVAFVATLVELRLLDEADDGTWVVHDWMEHNAWAARADARSEAARVGARARWDKRLQSKGSATPEPPECDRIATAMQGQNARFVSSRFVSSRLASSRDDSSPDGEKYPTGTPQNPAEAGSADPDPPPPPAPTETLVLIPTEQPPEIPECIKGTRFEADGKRDWPRWYAKQRAAYPDLDIDAAVRKADAWCEDNPKRAPKSDFGRFLGSWLRRAEDDDRKRRPGGSGGNTPRHDPRNSAERRSERIDASGGNWLATRRARRAAQAADTEEDIPL